jgi:hypothetical protein
MVGESAWSEIFACLFNCLPAELNASSGRNGRRSRIGGLRTFDVARLLLKFGAEVKAIAGEGRDATSWAREKGHLGIIKLFEKSKGIGPD